MIQIKKSATADTRSAEELVNKETLIKSSEQHIGDVQSAINFMRGWLSAVAEKHDHTKIELMDEFHANFKAKQEDKDDSVNFKTLGWYEKHVTQERHHLNDHVPEDVNLFDVLERVADITTAGMARSGSIYDDTLDPEILAKAYKNTVELLKNNIQVVE